MKVDRNINVVFAAILLFGACVFTACSKDDDEEVLGVDTTSRVDKYKEISAVMARISGKVSQNISRTLLSASLNHWSMVGGLPSICSRVPIIISTGSILYEGLSRNGRRQVKIRRRRISPTYLPSLAFCRMSPSASHQTSLRGG